MLAFPTETFYGLGCCADQAVAVARVYQAKRRPVHMPLPLLAGSLELLRPYVTLEQAPEALLTAFWPGPLTVVLTARLTPLEGRRPLAPQLVNPRGKAAVRLTPHPLAARLSCLAGAPLTASSANISGQAAARVPDELDERLLATPAVAIEVCHGVTMEMAELSKTTMKLAINMLFQYDKATEEQIEENENRIDKYEDKLNAYLVRISKHSLSSKDSRTVSKMLHCIGNFERIGDHAVNIMESAHELHEKGLHFSGDAAKELRTLCDALLETLNMAYQAFEKDDLAIAHQVEPLEEVIDTLNLELKNRHIKRLQNEECTVELGYIYQDLLTNIERISDHCSNIAGVLIEIDEQQNIHKYLYKLKENDETFQESYHQYLNHYYLELGQPTLDEVVDA